MKNRRCDDGGVQEIGTALPAVGSIATINVVLGGGLASAPTGTPSRGGAFLLRVTEGDRELVIAGSELAEICPRGSAPEQVARAEAKWRDQVRRTMRSEALPGKLIAFFADLHRAETEVDVCEGVSRHVLNIVGGYRAAVVVPERPAGVSSDDTGARERFVGTGAMPDEIGIMHRQCVDKWFTAVPEEVRGPFSSEQIAYVAHLPFGAGGVLLLAERRSERVLEADEWEILEAMAEQGEIALRRARMLAEAQELALTDSLTGLANRRQFDIVMKHAWAGAQRGEDLALLLLDIDDFKSVNDRHGHDAGDQLLRIVADVLTREARGADAVVRWGGDEFLILMPGGTSKGARTLANRITARLAGWVEVSIGVVSHHASIGSPSELLRAADERLYGEKRSRRRLT